VSILISFYLVICVASFQCTTCSLVLGLRSYVNTYFLLLGDLCGLCDLLRSFAAPCVYDIVVVVKNMVL
jgi:hypothetical protein